MSNTVHCHPVQVVAVILLWLAMADCQFDNLSEVTVKILPPSLVRVVGGSAMFECHATLSRPDARVRFVSWYRRGLAPFPTQRHAIYGDATMQNKTLIVWSLRFSDMGVYFCEVETTSGDRGSANGRLTVDDLRTTEGPTPFAGPTDPDFTTEPIDQGSLPTGPDTNPTTSPTDAPATPGVVEVTNDEISDPETPFPAVTTPRGRLPIPDFGRPETPALPTGLPVLPNTPRDTGGNPGEPGDGNGGQDPDPTARSTPMPVCDTDPCQNGGECTDHVDGSYTCSCTSGWAGPDCVDDINECYTGVHNCPLQNAECNNTEGSYTCKCHPGFQLQNGICIDVNECGQGGTDCSPSATCDNIPGSYRCECANGFSGNGTHCKPIICNGLPDPANGKVAYTDTFNINSIADYSCNRGYATRDPTYRLCLFGGVVADWTGTAARCNDIDECQDGTHGCDVNAECTNTPGSYRCDCKLGYTGDGFQCTHIACPQLDSPANGRVTVVGSGFQAQAVFQCNEGFKITGRDVLVCLIGGMWSSQPPTCDDIDECRDGTHQCSPFADCINTVGDYECVCKDGYTGNGRQCARIQCPLLEDPVNGGVSIVPSTRVFMSAATYSCNRGYSLTGPDIRVCAADGTWTSEAPKCNDDDECRDGTHNCDINAECKNTNGSYICICLPGYYGDGRQCRRIQCPALAPLQDGLVQLSNGLQFQSVATHSCSPGFQLKGQRRRTCQNSSTWSGVAPDCDDVNECVDDPCSPNARCINVPGSFRCVCLPGFLGDGFVCTEIQCPALAPLKDGRIQLSNGLQYQSVATHSCSPGYQLKGQRRRTCQNTSTWSANTPECNDVDECADNPCSPHARCINEPGSFRCVCIAGYRGDGFVCTDIPECDLGLDNCHKYADCINSPGSFNCECAEGYRGNGLVCVSDSCEELTAPINGTVTVFGSGINSVAIYYCNLGFDISGGRVRICQSGGQWSGQPATCNDRDECLRSRCHPLATCRNIPGSYVCLCPEGYTGDGRRCTPIDPCAVDQHNCHPNAECDGSLGTAVCTCKAGYVGDGFNCPDRDECKDVAFDTNCAQTAICNNLIATFECVCREGYAGDGINCKALDPCDDIVCGEHAVCQSATQADVRTARCECEPGYAGDPNVVCLYVDPCDSNPCSDGSVCSGSTQGYNCSCLPGYERIGPNICIDIIECIKEVDPCSEHAFCTNQPGTYECTCLPGFEGDGKTCKDIVECSDFNACSVNFDCKNTIGSFLCTCAEGYFLDRGECIRVVPGKCVKNGVQLEIDETRDFSLTDTQRAAPPAADIIFVIDESASMVTEHQWLALLSDQLNQALTEQGVGMAMPNYFGLVGFAKNDPVSVTGRVIRMESGRLFGSPLELSDATAELALDGSDEDLYYGILKALDAYPFRPGMACQIIGVTDEGRTPLPPPSNSSLTAPPTFNSVLARLQERRCALNVVVNQVMAAGDVSALGVGSGRDGFVERANGQFEALRAVGVPDKETAHGTTHRDYTQLAFATGGGAWNLNKLRGGGNTADAFTKAFVWLKEREIARQLCERCTCVEGRPQPLCQRGCFGEPPFEVVIRGGDNGPKDTPNPVNSGGIAEFRCYAEGDPEPYFQWTLADGSALPTAHQVLGEYGNVLQLRDVTRRTCVRCIAINSQGNSSAQQCVNVAHSCPTENGGIIKHGSSERNYSTIRGDDIINLPGSALVVFVVDESGSMEGEHEWLKTMAVTLEQNLNARDVQGNQYALVGFASPNPTRQDAYGRIIPVGRRGEHCGTAVELRDGLAQLHVDGRREDGFSAMGMALNDLSCMQDRQTQQPQADRVTACQIILITDEDRDPETSWTFSHVLNDLTRQDCILNVVIWGRFRGKSASGQNVRALGIDRRGRAVVASPDFTDFSFLPNGEFVKDTGYGTTKEDYITMANDTSGGAWDLEMLRTERYRESFTKGFMAAKVEEIQQQIFGTCKECECRNGTLLCQLLPGVSTRARCLTPPSTPGLTVQFGGGRRIASEGELLRLQCNATNAQGNQVTVIFRPHPLAAVQVGNELFFRNVSRADAGRYTCLARTAEGRDEAFVDLTVVPEEPSAGQPPPPQQPSTPARDPQPTPAPGPAGRPPQPFQNRNLIELPTGSVAVHASATALTLGDALLLTCCVGQQAYPVLDWYRLDGDGDEVPLPADSQISDKGQLVFLSLAARHNGVYQCIYRTVAGAESGETSLRVRGAAVTISPSATQCRV